MRLPWRRILRTLVTGAVLGLLVLGTGGRLAMALVQLDMGQRPSFSFGGTSTVVFLGGVSGLAGAALALVSGWVTRRLPPRSRWLEYPLFGALLLLVTTRGLRGAPSASWWYFYLLVAVYGAAMALITQRHRRITAAP